LALLVCLVAVPAAAAPGDTTWVRTFQEDFINWATPHDSSFTFPDDPFAYSQVVLFYTIGCPTSPGDCDPWDRLGYLQVVGDTEMTEIARIVTPYDITGGGGPGTCTWEINVSPYKTLLTGEVTLRNYIESWIGGTRGWLATLDFAFIEGEREYEPYRVANLWQAGHATYGDPDNPVDAAFQPMTIPTDPATAKIKVRVLASGHGQGNTDNCAEFCRKEHSLIAGGDTYSHNLWRTDCSVNPCSPQGGTWTFARAGWCPGADVKPWNVDITSSFTPGQPITLDYDIEPYENFCRPSNPDCVSGSTCADCDYNYTGHTQPHYTIRAQAILYYLRTSVTGAGEQGNAETASGRSMNVNASPNPFSGSTTLTGTVSRPGRVRVTIHDASGRLVRAMSRFQAVPGTLAVPWDGRDTEGTPVAAGTYFARMIADGTGSVAKVVVIR
jgi:hypothetical protein